jgi:hypothetical protein
LFIPLLIVSAVSVFGKVKIAEYMFGFLEFFALSGQDLWPIKMKRAVENVNSYIYRFPYTGQSTLIKPI